MNRERLDIPRRRHQRRIGLCAVAILIAVMALPGLAQDLKPVSASLAARIQVSGRRTVAVVDFTDLQGNVTELGRYLAEELSVALVSDAKGFKVIDRTHLKSILQEHKLATTGLIDPQTARQLGQIAGVDTLVTGSITALGDNVRLSAKVLDTTTAEMIAASTVDVPKTKAIEELLARGIGGTQPAGAVTNPPPANTTGNQAAKPISGQDGDLLFVVRVCSRSGARLSCSGSITNKAAGRLGVTLSSDASFVIDDLGNQYRLKDLMFGSHSVYSGINPEVLEPDLPLNFSILADDVNTAARLANIMLAVRSVGERAPAGSIVGARPDRTERVTIRSVPIQQR